MKTELYAVILVICSSLIGAFGPIYLKKGTDRITSKLSSIYANKFLIFGIFLYGTSTLLFIPALKGGDLSVLYPLVGLSYVWVCFYSSWLLKEKMNFLKWLGIFIIVVGISLIGIGV
jgi:uncharacterized membrane protein